MAQFDIKDSLIGLDEQAKSSIATGSIVSVDFGTKSIFGPIIVAAVNLPRAISKSDLTIIDLSRTENLTDKEIVDIYPRVQSIVEATVYIMKPAEWNMLSDDVRNVESIRIQGHNSVHLQNASQSKLHIAKGYTSNDEYNTILNKVFQRSNATFTHVQASKNPFDKNFESHLAYIVARYYYIKFIEEYSSKINARIPWDGSQERQEQFLFLLSQTENGIARVRQITRVDAKVLNFLKLSMDELRNSRNRN